MKAVGFADFAQYEYNKYQVWRHSHENHCRICDEPITDRALYCVNHSGYRRLLNEQMDRWRLLEEKFAEGAITLDESYEIRVWP